MTHMTERWRRSKERPHYYLTPSRDFTQYTRDYEEKYWRRDTAFDWTQDVEANLRRHLEWLTGVEFQRIAEHALPLLDQDLAEHLGSVGQWGLPDDEDGLKSIADSIPSDRGAIRDAIAICAPLERLGRPIADLQDQLLIFERERLELEEQKRLGLFRTEVGLRRVETEAERREQSKQLALLAEQTDQVRQDLQQPRFQRQAELVRIRQAVNAELDAIAPQVRADLADTRTLVRRSLEAGEFPSDPPALERLRDLVCKRQLRGLKDLANHCIVVEQSAIAPLTMGIIHFRRRREIQEAMTTFAHDEAKHTAVFRRFMAEKMKAKERVPDAIVKSGERYLWIARCMPGAAMFLAVVVESIGGAFLEFFGRNENMPDPLFRSICRIIAERDEKRHQALCSATYSELYQSGSRWERVRNHLALHALLKAAYGDKTEDHPLIQACRAFGLESDTLYRFVAGQLSAQLKTIGLVVSWESLLEFLPRRARRPAQAPLGYQTRQAR